MSNIDEIMGAVGRHGDDCIRDADAASESFDGLREMIAAALADAERKGAEAMREQCADRWDGHDIDVLGHCTNVGASIRALPLPTGTVNVVMDREHGGLTFAPAKREPVLLRHIVQHIDAQAAQIERLKATAARADTQAAVLRTVERWANHHARKPKTTAEEALSVIQHHPAIRDITASYADGVVPDTPDPYAEIERLRDELALCCQLKREYQEQAK